MQDNKHAELADLMKDPYQRGTVSAKDINDAKLCIGSITNVDDLYENINAIYDLFRYLRNTCVECKKNQNLIVNSGLIQDVKILVELVFDPSLLAVADGNIVNKLKLVSVQFLGNLVVQNKPAVRNVWDNCFPNLFFTMMSNFDGKGKDYVCMVIYNCLRDSFNLANKREECWLMNSVIDHCNAHSDVEWGLLVMELVISSENFRILYEELLDYPVQKISLMDILLGYLTDGSSNGLNIPESNLMFLSEQFETKSSCIMLLTGNKSHEVLQECQLLYKLLCVLSAATAYAEKYPNLRSSESLLKTAVDLLKQVCACTEAVVTGTTNHDTEHPMFDLKRNLVKVIGNMCYKNKHMQDKVCEYEAIVPLLNCCIIDERNPYLMQWAIFSLRAICEGNLENQNFISGLENHGVIADLDTNVGTRLENGKIRICSIAEE